MKKFAAIALATCLMLSCLSACHAMEIGGGLSVPQTEMSSADDMPVSNEAVKTDPNYIEARIEVVPWPVLPENGIPIFYTANKCLVAGLPGEGFAPFLYNTKTGISRYLYALSEDDEIWREVLVPSLQIMGMSDDEIEYMINAYDSAALYFAMIQCQDDIMSYVIEGDKIYLNFSVDSFVIDINNRTIRLSAESVLMNDGMSIKWIGDDEVDYVFTDKSGNKTNVKMSGDPGYEYTPCCMEFDWNTSVVCVHEDDKYSGNARFALGFAEGYTGGELEFVDLGVYNLSGGPQIARLCGKDAALAWNKASITMYPLLLARRGAAEAEALIWDGEYMTAVPVSELIGESGTVSMKGNDYRYLYPLDVSDTGRYAAFIEGGNGDLLIMDIETLETKCLMTQAEMDSMGLGSMFNSLIGWLGSDTILGNSGYDLKFVFD